MSIANVLPLVSILNEAERELAAFLCAATSVVGLSGLPRASDFWIHVMEGLDWPDENFEKFFRGVTIRAVAQLLEDSTAGFSHMENARDFRANVTLHQPR